MVAWGFISDVHGNLAALDSALVALERAGAVHLAFLGDYLGKGHPDECVLTIREVAAIALVGNRDLDWAPRVSANSREWVMSLPRSTLGEGFFLAHGDGRLTPDLSTDQIRRDFLKPWDVMQQGDARLAAFGHSHNARIWEKVDRRGPARLVSPSEGLTMRVNARYYLNVGTTGMPFPGKGGPSVALVDLAMGSIRLIDIGGAIAVDG